jgi:hypothetical protein
MTTQIHGGKEWWIIEEMHIKTLELSSAYSCLSFCRLSSVKRLATGLRNMVMS